MNSRDVPLDARFVPPAPVLSLPVRRPDGEDSLSVDFFVDTGADRTVLPLATAIALGFDAAAAETRRSVAPDRVVTPRPVGRFELTLLGRRITCICFVIDTNLGLLGRDVLQHFCFVFDGPAGTLTVAD